MVWEIGGGGYLGKFQNIFRFPIIVAPVSDLCYQIAGFESLVWSCIAKPYTCEEYLRNACAHVERGVVFCVFIQYKVATVCMLSYSSDYSL